MIELEPARWLNGPLICPAANLPFFESPDAASGFMRKLCPESGGGKYGIGQCEGCGGWHILTGKAAPGPAKENHERFLSHLESSQSAVELAAGWFERRGFSAKVQPMKKAPTRSEWKKYADNGDLLVTREGRTDRVEVKRLRVNFTCEDNWPFGEKFIVCAKHSFDRAKPKPSLFVILSGSGTHAAIVDASSFPKWTVEERTDSRYEDVSQEFYLAPLSEVTWTAL